LGVWTSHGRFGLLDSPRPGLGGSHHLPHTWAKWGCNSNPFDEENPKF